jgi:hypothetical protein
MTTAREGNLSVNVNYNIQEVPSSNLGPVDCHVYVLRTNVGVRNLSRSRRRR